MSDENTLADAIAPPALPAGHATWWGILVAAPVPAAPPTPARARAPRAAKPKPKPTKTVRRGIVSDLIEYLKECGKSPSEANTTAEQVRRFLGGASHYFPSVSQDLRANNTAWILRLSADGKSARTIAADVGVSRATVLRTINHARSMAARAARQTPTCGAGDAAAQRAAGSLDLP